MAIDAIIGHEKDNVATATADIAAGMEALTRVGSEIRKLTVREEIPYGHKFAVAKMKQGDAVIKYGEIIGGATAGIEEGRHVHVHNVMSLRGRGDLK